MISFKKSLILLLLLVLVVPLVSVFSLSDLFTSLDEWWVQSLTGKATEGQGSAPAPLCEDQGYQCMSSCPMGKERESYICWEGEGVCCDPDGPVILPKEQPKPDDICGDGVCGMYESIAYCPEDCKPIDEGTPSEAVNEFESEKKCSVEGEMQSGDSCLLERKRCKWIEKGIAIEDEKLSYLINVQLLGCLETWGSQQSVCEDGNFVSKGCAVVPGVEIETLEETELETNTQTAQILDVPFREDFNCFLYENQDKPECKEYYKTECIEDTYDEDICYKTSACPRYVKPVCGTDGLFYPSPCWAEQLGTSVASYGYCPAIKNFIADMWKTPAGSSTRVEKVILNSPQVTFSYIGDPYFEDLWTGFRSTLWTNATHFKMMDFFIEGGHHKMTTGTSKIDTSASVYDTRRTMLMIFILFDEAYTEQVLINLTKKYEPYLNQYLREKQEVSKPIQYDLIPVVIDPPQGVTLISDDEYYTDEQIQKIIDASLEKIDEEPYDIVVLSPVTTEKRSGKDYLISHKGIELIKVGLYTNLPYSTTNKEAGLNALGFFQFTMKTLGHEILHSLGLQADHIPLGGYNMDTFEDEEMFEEANFCNYWGTRPNYYPVELPTELTIYTGQEPSWAIKKESSTGNCLVGFLSDQFLKDYNQDGEYEIMYGHVAIGAELQGTLGWIDIDGDGIAELEDPNPYGGYLIEQSEEKEKILIDCPVGQNCNENIWASFEPLGEEVISGCTFENIQLENGQEGLVPLQCEEFKKDIVNLYKGVTYRWEIVEKDYGKILLPRLS